MQVWGGAIEVLSYTLARYEHTFDLVETTLRSDSGSHTSGETTITGEVTDAETGEGVEGATLSGLDPATGDDLFETTTDAFGEYETTFTIDDAPDEIKVVADAEGYETAEVAASFEEEMTLDLSLTPIEDPGDTQATISGTITDEETGEGIEAATVTGADPTTGDELFEVSTDAFGDYETTFNIEETPAEVAVSASADEYEVTEQTIGFAKDMQVNLSLPPADAVPPSGDAIYYEDFSNDPGYTTLYSNNTVDQADIYWDEEQENYYSRVYDQTSDWWSVGVSPSFDKVYPEDSFEFSFHFNPIEPDWGHYPGIFLVDSESYDLDGDLKNEAETVGAFRIYWSDNRYKLFGFGRGKNRYYSPTIPRENEWYEVTINYDGSTQTTDLLILREDGQVFLDEKNLSVAPTGAFDQFWIGEVGGRPAYGDKAQIRIDNIKIEK